VSQQLAVVGAVNRLAALRALVAVVVELLAAQFLHQSLLSV
jgi:hypothetical protein